MLLLCHRCLFRLEERLGSILQTVHQTKNEKNHLKANSSQNTKKKYKQQRYIIFGIDTTVCFVPKTDYMHMTKRNQLAAELTGQIDHWLIDGARIERTKLARHDGFMLSVFNIISTMMFINLKIIIMNMKYTTINKLRLRKSTNCQKNSGFKAKVMRLNSFSSFFFTGRTHAVLVSHMLSKILSVSRVY